MKLKFVHNKIKLSLSLRLFSATSSTNVLLVALNECKLQDKIKVYISQDKIKVRFHTR